MKEILFIILFCFSAFIKNAQAQTTGVPDTLSYLQTIVANKAQYIGQPFSVLSNNLQIQIKFFSPIASIPYDKNKETSTLFSFYFPQNAEEIYLTYPSLEIYWVPCLNSVQSRLLHSQYRSVGWATAVTSFYANAIIADIRILE